MTGCLSPILDDIPPVSFAVNHFIALSGRMGAILFKSAVPFLSYEFQPSRRGLQSDPLD